MIFRMWIKLKSNYCFLVFFFVHVRLGEYHIKNYASALESFREGQRLDSKY